MSHGGKCHPVEPTPPPDRRIPGWKLVLVLVIIGIIVLIPALFFQFSPRFGPPLLLIRITDAIRATPENASVSADLGPHCSPIWWDAPTRSLTATSEVRLAGAEGLFLQRFEQLSENIASEGGDLVRSTLAVNGSTWTFTSPVDSRALATFVRSGENLTVGGTTYGPGDSWPLSFAYNVTTPGGNVRIEESLTFTNEGVVRPRIVLPSACA
jgi:hypothetical protein